MTTTAPVANAAATKLEKRILNESYGPGAWHGADLKAALADVSPEQAFWRPGAGRHNIAEIALHHAYCARSVRGRLLGVTPEPFLLEGDDWFALSNETTVDWSTVLATVDAEQQKLGQTVADLGRGAATSPLTDDERFDLILGIACHAIYHAGQVQLIKVLRAG
jgi:hypothetical protein